MELIISFITSYFPVSTLFKLFNPHTSRARNIQSK
ncbi:hypothetical protein BVRB_8g193100 [Beta vulgaris subsp. vulgaris]|nr:hypothetical protein BVRB_8g193100 [Beta vulgaris subsp. vulgaris]